MTSTLQMIHDAGMPLALMLMGLAWCLADVATLAWARHSAECAGDLMRLGYSGPARRVARWEEIGGKLGLLGTVIGLVGAVAQGADPDTMMAGLSTMLSTTIVGIVIELVAGTARGSLDAVIDEIPTLSDATP